MRKILIYSTIGFIALFIGLMTLTGVQQKKSWGGEMDFVPIDEPVMGGTLDITSITADLSLADKQTVAAEFEKLDNGVIEYIPKYIKNNITFTKHHYKTPTGETGIYLIYYLGNQACTVATGPEAVARTKCYDTTRYELQ